MRLPLFISHLINFNKLGVGNLISNILDFKHKSKKTIGQMWSLICEE